MFSEKQEEKKKLSLYNIIHIHSYEIFYVMHMFYRFKNWYRYIYVFIIIKYNQLTKSHFQGTLCI